VWERIWQKLKRWLVRKLVTEPHSVFLHGRRSGTAVQLEFATTIDAPVFIETQIVHYLVRLITRVSFRTPAGGWTEPERALIDTGSPVSVIPHSIWQNVAHSFLTGETVIDIAGMTISGRLGLVTLRLWDGQTVSPPLRVKANLVWADNLPLILGFSDVLT
jgi:hypothetical protein